MSGPLAGQVAIVTGAGRGVGRAIAEALASAGASVALAARSGEEIEAVRAAVEAGGGRAVAVPADVTDEPAVGALVAETIRTLGSPTLLVSNAGSWQSVGPLAEADAERWWRDVEVNVKGPFLCARAVLPSMCERGGGRIVNVSSYAAIVPQPYATAYAASKAAVLSLTESLAAEVAGRGVRVFAISPGFVRTRMVADVIESEAGRRYVPEIAARQDAVEPERAGALVVDIASGRLDPLAGRFLHVQDDVDDLLGRADEIRAGDLYTLRLRR